jgi:DNA-binding XRE family transcriptional regulator
MTEKQKSTIYINNLRTLRIAPRMSQWELALQSGVKQSRISLIENFLVKASMREKIKLAEALHYTIEEVFPDAEYAERTNTTSDNSITTRDSND